MRLIDRIDLTIQLATCKASLIAESEWTRGYKDGLTAAFDLLAKAPSIEAEPVKHGFNAKQKAFGDDAFECSICGYEDWDCMTCEPKHHNYCPNCGAKMKGDAG